MPDFAAADGTLLYFSDEGAGLPLVALPGLTRSGRDFDFVAPHLPALRLIRLDLRGRGRSARADPASYTVGQEAKDVLALLDHLGLGRAAILGTSRGGLVGMMLGAIAKDRLLGVALNDIGPVVEPAGLAYIASYLGLPPKQRTWDEAAAARARAMTAFKGIPAERWRAEAERLWDETPEGLALRYDPALRQAVFGAPAGPAPDLWPLFDSVAGLPLCLIRADGSDILSQATADEMARRRPDMIRAEVPGRGHVPFLDEPEALAALRSWLDLMTP